MRYVWATGTHQGRIRERNEDSVYPETSGAGNGPIIVAVADGMGGHVAGNVASALALATATEASPDSDIETVERLVSANEAILERVREQQELSGMGTTMTLGRFLDDGTLELAHVGDSRCYLARGDELRQLSTDHTVVAELVALGHLNPDDVDTHPQRHLVTRTLGLGPVTIESETLSLEEGDRLVFCSDGLTSMVKNDDIRRIVTAGDDPEATIWNLIEAANSAGGVDNITVAMVDARA
ncbi:MAG: SpoIIE family protein phosphatase [Acidimicrobiia bacterium]|nr:SpoIIE family protein phosphatase [Acidimicrobiia bacterium]